MRASVHDCCCKSERAIGQKCALTRGRRRASMILRTSWLPPLCTPAVHSVRSEAAMAKLVTRKLFRSDARVQASACEGLARAARSAARPPALAAEGSSPCSWCKRNAASARVAILQIDRLILTRVPIYLSIVDTYSKVGSLVFSIYFRLKTWY